jgi:hypothetical protein
MTESSLLACAPTENFVAFVNANTVKPSTDDLNNIALNTFKFCGLKDVLNISEPKSAVVPSAPTKHFVVVRQGKYVRLPTAD